MEMNLNFGTCLFLGIGLLQILAFKTSLCLNTTHITIKCSLDDNDVDNNESFLSLWLVYRNSLVARISHTGESFINETSSFEHNITFSSVTNFQISLELDVASEYMTSHFQCYIEKSLSSNNTDIVEKQLKVEKEFTNDKDLHKGHSSLGKDEVEGLQGTRLLIAVCVTGLLIVLIVIVAVPIAVWRKRKALPVSVNSVFFLPRCVSESWPNGTDFQPDIYAFEPGIQFYYSDIVPNFECSSIQTD